MNTTIHRQLRTIFKNGSRTYFYSSLFFPDDVRDDVFALYSFVRTADDLVDQTPPQTARFRAFRKAYEQSLKGKTSNNVVIESFVRLQIKRKFDPVWVKSFLAAMERDLTQITYPTMKDSIAYMHGSAEVIGLMMSQILDLPHTAHTTARYLGRAMQYVNFIRDITEDNALGRTYFSQTELKKYHLPSLRKEDVITRRADFVAFLHAQIKQYEVWSKKGEEGYAFIPRRYLIPIKTANDLYSWTARKIAKQPMIVFEQKVKPSLARIIFTLLKNMILIP